MVRSDDTIRPWRSKQLRGSMKSRKQWVRPIVAKDRVCIFIVWQDEMKMTWGLSTPESPKYKLHVAHSTSVTSVSPYTHRRLLTMYLEAVMEWVWSCTWRLSSSELRDTLRGCDRASLYIQLQTDIVWTERCTCRRWLSKYGDALGGQDQVNSEIHSEAVSDRVWRWTGRPWSSKFGDAIGYSD